MKKTEFNELIEKAFSMGYEYALLEKNFSKDDDEVEPISKIAKRNAKIGAITGGLGGALGGVLKSKNKAKGALIGSAYGAGMGAISMGLGSAIGTKLRRSLKNKSKNYKELSEIMKDENKVKKGEMSNEEFFEKYPYLK